MNFLEILLLSLALSMDSFAISLTSGVIMRTPSVWRTVKIALLLAVFQAAMPFIGWIIGAEFKHFIEDCDHWIVFAILLFLGGKMIIESIRHQDDEHACFDPSNTKTLIGLSLATSIDALAVGISLAFLGQTLLVTLLTLGITTFICSVAGIRIGARFGKRMKSGAEILGGILLILIGVRVLIEHLADCN